MRRTSLSERTYIRSIIGDGEVDDKAIWMVGKGILQAVKVGMLIKTGSVRDLQQMARHLDKTANSYVIEISI